MNLATLISKPKLIGSKGLPGPIMVIGDYPTQNEMSNGWAFNGPPGNLLASLCAPFKIDTGRLYRTHYFKVPIPGYASPIKKVKEAALAKVVSLEDWDLLISEEITAAQPNVILSCGELALTALTGEKGIKKWRGSILHLDKRLGNPAIKVLPIHSPREIWDQNSLPFVYTQWDCSKLLEIKDLKQRYEPKELIWIAENHTMLVNWWQRAKDADFLTLDIETHHGFVTCIGFSHNGHEAVSVPFLVGKRMDYQERGAIYRTVRDILASPIPKVNQNIKYDESILENYGFRIRNIVGDTMLMAHTIYPQLPKGLDFLNSIYTTLPYYKDEGRKYDPRQHSVDRLLKYNARDALCTHQIWTKQQDDAKAMKVDGFYQKYVQPAYFTYKRMDATGIRVDETQRRKLVQKYLPQFKEFEITLSLVNEKHLNINSPTQVGDFIYNVLKCPKETHQTPSGETAWDTDENTIEELYVNKVSDPSTKTLLKSLIYARKLSRVLQFLRAPISPDGRMRTSYKLHGTKSGRTSAGKSLEPSFYIERGKIHEQECGGSFQTIPKHGIEFGTERIGADLRSIFVPRTGYHFVEGDQSQAEDRVVCVLAEDWDGLEILNKKVFQRNEYGLKDDRHSLTACLITGKPFEKITPDDRQVRGKKPRHAGNYNMGIGMLQLFTHLPFHECKRILDTFHSTNPKIRGIFHEQIRDRINRDRFLRSPHGRRQDFFGTIDEDVYKQAYSTLPQATVSDHSKFTILEGLAKIYSEPLAFPVNEAHDSVMFEVRDDLVEPFTEDFHRLCEIPIDFSQCSLPRDYRLIIPGDVSWSADNWAAMEK